VSTQAPEHTESPVVAQTHTPALHASAALAQSVLARHWTHWPLTESQNGVPPAQVALHPDAPPPVPAVPPAPALPPVLVVPPAPNPASPPSVPPALLPAAPAPASLPPEAGVPPVDVAPAAPPLPVAPLPAAPLPAPPLLPIEPPLPRLPEPPLPEPPLPEPPVTPTTPASAPPTPPSGAVAPVTAELSLPQATGKQLNDDNKIRNADFLTQFIGDDLSKENQRGATSRSGCRVRRDT
jgi:hypothetical protein